VHSYSFTELQTPDQSQIQALVSLTLHLKSNLEQILKLRPKLFTELQFSHVHHMTFSVNEQYILRFYSPVKL
jgi:hypothetical protein